MEFTQASPIKLSNEGRGSILNMIQILRPTLLNLTARVRSWLNYSHSNRHLKTGARSYRNQFEGGAAPFDAKARLFEIVFCFYDFRFLENGAGSWRLTRRFP